jgi:hypothetical protein
MRTVAIAIVASGLTALGVGTAQAQQKPQIDPKACAPSDRLHSDGTMTKSRETAGESLSDKLARTDGVICPPDVGPDIRLKAPDTGTTPVIPPPGTPGGDPTVRPK